MYDGDAQPAHWRIDKNNDHIGTEGNQKGNKIREGGRLFFFRTQKKYSRISPNCTDLFE